MAASGKLILLIFSLLILPLPALAGSELSMSAATELGNIAYNEQARFSVSVTNNQPVADTICLVTPSWGSARFDNDQLFLGAKSSASANLKLTPPSDVVIGTYAVEISARSCTKPRVQATALAKIIVTSELPHITSSIDVPGQLAPGTHDLKVVIKNAGTNTISGLSGEISSDFFPTKKFDIGSVKYSDAASALSEKLAINRNVPVGKHTIVVDIYQNGKLLNTQVKRVEVVASSDIQASETVEKNFLRTKHTIVFENIGNQQAAREYSAEFPTGQRPFFFSNPKATVTRTNGVSEASWQLNLAPGQKATVIYSVSYTWLITLVIVILILAYILLVYYGKEIVVSKSVSKSAKSLRVKLSVKNTTNQTLQNVTVTDFVPTPLKVLKEFEMAEPEAIKREHGHVKLVWKLDNLYPNEERVFIYSLKSSLSIFGSLALPQAIARVKVSGKQKSYSSGSVGIAGKLSVSED